MRRSAYEIIEDEIDKTGELGSEDYSNYEEGVCEPMFLDFYSFVLSNPGVELTPAFLRRWVRDNDITAHREVGGAMVLGSTNKTRRYITKYIIDRSSEVGIKIGDWFEQLKLKLEE